MYFNSKGLLPGLLFGLLPVLTMAQETLPSLEVKPGKCVVISKGRDCYVDVQVQWQSADVGNYCLYASPPLGRLRCWQQSERGQWYFELQSKVNVRFWLVHEGQSEPLVSDQLTVNWVYKKVNRKRRWRIF